MTPPILSNLFRFSEIFGPYVMPGLAAIWAVALPFWVGQKVLAARKSYAAAPARIEVKDEWKTAVLMVQEPATSNS
jgi:hypothetical protein